MEQGRQQRFQARPFGCVSKKFDSTHEEHTTLFVCFHYKSTLFTFSKYLFIDVKDLIHTWPLKKSSIGNHLFLNRNPHSFQCLIRNITDIKIIVSIQSISFPCTIKSFGCEWSHRRALYPWFKGGIKQFCPWYQSKDSYLVLSTAMCSQEKFFPLEACKAPTSSHKHYCRPNWE